MQHPARGFQAGSRREVEGGGAAVRVKHLVNGTTPLGLCSIRMQRIRERTCEAWLSASAAREPEVGSAWAGCERWSSYVTFALGSIFSSRLYPS